MRILYVHSTLVPPPKDVRRDRFHLLSEVLEGDILQPIWFQNPEEITAMFGEGSYPVYSIGRFRYHWILSTNLPGWKQKLDIFRSYVRKGLELHKERPFDCIVAYSHMTTGMMAGVLKLLTGAKLVIEIVTSPQLVYITEIPKPGLREWLMRMYSDICLHISTTWADRMHFLFPDQLSHYPLLRNKANSVFHEFVPVSGIQRFPEGQKPEPYILLIGMPWYLKGSDVAIQAFRKIALEFPKVKLKLLGYFPDRTVLDQLIGELRQIDIMRAIPPAEALKVIEQSSVVILPSRCEGLPRVLIEAMAAGLPVIGSTVGGIPSLIRNGENGFIVPVGDVDALAARMKTLLGDASLRQRMGELNYTRAHSDLTEEVYVREFARMIESAVRGS
jgi:glycosyltransferase involved in cell wall biosynthesis